MLATVHNIFTGEPITPQAEVVRPEVTSAELYAMKRRVVALSRCYAARRSGSVRVRLEALLAELQALTRAYQAGADKRRGASLQNARATVHWATDILEDY